MRVHLVMSAVFFKTTSWTGWRRGQSVVHLPVFLFFYTPPIRHHLRHLPSTQSERGHRACPSSVRGGAEPGGAAARAGTDGGQTLLAAVQEGRVVGALMAAVVVVRLPALTLPLPPTAKDPDERLKTKQREAKRQHEAPVTPQVTASGRSYLFELAAVAGIDDGVQAAVEVTEPENDFEEGFRRTETTADGA